MLDTFMLVMFLFFMVFIFAGYHKTKSEQREKYDEARRKAENTPLQ